jgi:hypothetical protein
MSQRTVTSSSPVERPSGPGIGAVFPTTLGAYSTVFGGAGRCIRIPNDAEPRRARLLDVPRWCQRRCRAQCGSRSRRQRPGDRRDVLDQLPDHLRWCPRSCSTECPWGTCSSLGWQRMAVRCCIASCAADPRTSKATAFIRRPMATSWSLGPPTRRWWAPPAYLLWTPFPVTHAAVTNTSNSTYGAIAETFVWRFSLGLTGPVESSTNVGTGCGTGSVLPFLSANAGVLGGNLNLSLLQAPPLTAGVLFFGNGGIVPLGNGCTAWVNPATAAPLFNFTTGPTGQWSVSVPLPSKPEPFGGDLLDADVVALRRWAAGIWRPVEWGRFGGRRVGRLLRSSGQCAWLPAGAGWSVADSPGSVWRRLLPWETNRRDTFPPGSQYHQARTHQACYAANCTRDGSASVPRSHEGLRVYGGFSLARCPFGGGGGGGGGGQEQAAIEQIRARSDNEGDGSSEGWGLGWRPVPDGFAAEHGRRGPALQWCWRTKQPRSAIAGRLWLRCSRCERSDWRRIGVPICSSMRERQNPRRDLL